MNWDYSNYYSTAKLLFWIKHEPSSDGHASSAKIVMAAYPYMHHEEMILINCECQMNSREASGFYSERFPRD